jgi:BolA protein
MLDYINKKIVNQNVRKEIIEKILQNELNPQHLILIDESQKHKGHSGVKDATETHFQLIIVSDKFQNKNLLTRHKIINSLLKDEFANGLHALSMKCLTPSEHIFQSKI